MISRKPGSICSRPGYSAKGLPSRWIETDAAQPYLAAFAADRRPLEPGEPFAIDLAADDLLAPIASPSSPYRSRPTMLDPNPSIADLDAMLDRHRNDDAAMEKIIRGYPLRDLQLSEHCVRRALRHIGKDDWSFKEEDVAALRAEGAKSISDFRDWLIEELAGMGSAPTPACRIERLARRRFNCAVIVRGINRGSAVGSVGEGWHVAPEIHRNGNRRGVRPTP
jgi:hypothetical protein